MQREMLYILSRLSALSLCADLKNNYQQKYVLYATNPSHGVRSGGVRGPLCYIAASVVAETLDKKIRFSE